MFASIIQVQKSLLFIFFLRKLKWLKITQFLFLRIKKSEITGFYMEKNSKLTRSQVFDPRISAIVRFVVDGVAKLVFVSVAVEAE